MSLAEEFLPLLDEIADLTVPRNGSNPDANLVLSRRGWSVMISFADPDTYDVEGDYKSTVSVENSLGATITCRGLAGESPEQVMAVLADWLVEKAPVPA